MEVGLSLPIKMTGEHKELYTLNARKIGVKSIWIGDNPPINNAFLDIGRLLKGIPDIEFWTGITSPFYYSLEVLFALSIWLYSNYSKRFGLGLGIGNPDVINDPTISKKPFTHFTKTVEDLLQIVDIRKNQVGLEDFPPLAIGGLGEKMLQFARRNADYLLLNSISHYDIERALNQIKETSEINKLYKIIPYGMLQIFTDDKEISLTVWNIIKDIAKTCSTKILKNHGYSTKKIQKIREMTWDWHSKVPKGEMLEITNDFGIVGTPEKVTEKFEELKKYSKNNYIDRFVLGWIHTYEQWDELKLLIKMLR